MLKKIILTFFFLLNFIEPLYASIKDEIINNLIKINNLSFNFKQTIDKKTEEGNCIIEYPKKIFCSYNNSLKKIMVSKAGKKIEHTAVYPDELVRRIIELCSLKNDLVVDPFTGSGTTVSTANKLGRKWIGYELNTSYNELISWRLKSDVII